MAAHAPLLLCFLALISVSTLLAVADLNVAATLDKAAQGREVESQVSVYSNYDNNYGGQKVWCVGKPAAEDMYLRRNIDYACGEGGVDCRLIQEGGTCFLPNSPIAHASFAMNLYYQKSGRNWWNCHFNNTGLVVFTDPSFGNCKYTAQWRI